MSVVTWSRVVSRAGRNALHAGQSGISARLSLQSRTRLSNRRPSSHQFPYVS